jgi:hypothetical protein
MTFSAPFRALPAVFLGAALLLSGCDSFVSKSPISNPSRETFYQTQNDFETALAGAYDALQQEGTYSNVYWQIFEMRGETTDQGPDQTGLARTIFLLNTFAETSTNEQLQTAWLDTYDGIERCNLILDQIDALPEGTARNRIRGQALFLRSLFYYHAAVAWEDITLKLSPTSTASEAFDVTSQTEGPGPVYEQISDDLETAQDLLPVDYTPEESGEPEDIAESEKASSGAANTLLAKVYLTMGQAGDAETALQRVIDSGEYELLPNYGDLWGPENENNAESIFEVQYTTTSGEGSPFTNTFSPAAHLQTGEGLAENRPTETMLDAYFDYDGPRFDASMDTVYADGPDEGTAPDTARHIEKYESNPFANFEAENNWIVFRYADVLLMMAEAIGPNGTTADGRTGWDLINQVRNRSVPGAPDAGPSRGGFYEQLLRERKVELAFENHRWPDLKRFDQQYGVSAFDRVSQEVEGLSQGDFSLRFLIPQRERDNAGLSSGGS